MIGVRKFDAGCHSRPYRLIQTGGGSIREVAFARGQEPGKFEFAIDLVEIQ
jgi:hypothetical protein